jgi:hypothetical protein
MKYSSRLLISEVINKHGWLLALIGDPESFHGYYKFIWRTLKDIGGMQFYPFTFLSLPLFAYAFRDRESRTLVLSIGFLGVIAISFLTKAVISSVIGNYHIFWSTMAAYVNLMVIVFGCVVFFISRWLSFKPIYFSILFILFLLIIRFYSHVRSYSEFAILGKVYTDLAFLILTIAFTCLMIRKDGECKSIQRTLPRKNRYHALTITVLSSLILTYETNLISVNNNRRGDLNTILNYPYTPSKISKDKIKSLNEMSQAGVLYNESDTEASFMWDEETYKFILNQLPKRKIWLTANSARILIADDQYSPLWSYNGHLAEGFRINLLISEKFFDGEMKVDMSKLFKYPERLQNLVREYGVHYILVGPSFYKSVLSHFQINKSQIEQNLKIIFKSNNYIIFEVVSN